MKFFLQIIILLILNHHFSFAGGAGKSAQDNYIYYIAFILLILIWAVPKIFLLLKKMLHHLKPGTDETIPMNPLENPDIRI